jgi:para-aminobenzoate synthetase/4-amino-4-deoxychorismate lyase
MVTFAARFDDLTGTGQAWELADPVGEIIAEEPAEVHDALRQVDRAARDGCWAAGFVAYEAAPGLDPALRVAERRGPSVAGAVPLVWFGLFRERRAVTLVPPPRPDDPTPAWERWTANVTEAEHAGAVARVRDQIAEGNTYQVNYGVRLTGRPPIGALYSRLCHAQRGAYGARIDTGRFELACASPELFFTIDGRRLTTKPMKGTARRGRWPEEDEAQRTWLSTSEKDRAENIMIVDLLRNDVGKIAAVGSVRVEELFAVERYETVWQLTSTITGLLAPDTNLAQVFGALFPCGSVTGAPKVRTMQIIAELERAPRGVFCGGVGLVGPPSPAANAAVTARFAVGIRTVVVDRDRDLAEYGVGSGITWGSDAAAEYRELQDKSRILTHQRPAFALLETMAYHPSNGLRNGEAHQRRMAASAVYFGFAWDDERVASALKETLRGLPAAVRVRLTVDRDGAPTVTVSPLPTQRRQLVRVAVDGAPVDAADPFVFHKTTRRAHLDDRLLRHDDVDDVLLVNERDELTESTIANLAVELEGRWWTPPVLSGCLPGVGRAAYIDQGRLAERVISRHDLLRASGVALVSSLRGWRPAVVVDVARCSARGSSLDTR